MNEPSKLPRNPSFTPSPRLRRDLERHHGKGGTTTRINQIWDRYSHLINADALELDEAERQVLLNVLCGSLIDITFILCLEQEVRDCDDYLEGVPAAKTLLEKVIAASYGQRLATIEALGF